MRRLRGDAIFQSGHLSQDLAGKSVRGGVTTMTAQGIQFVLNLVGTMVLARLLTPSDFGLIAMVTVVVGFAGMFKDAGLSMATVQRGSISREQISTLFWLNVLLSAFLGLCILAASPLVAWFYGRLELTAVTAMLSLSFIITGLTIQHTALLRRHMRFELLAFIGIASQVLRLIVVILLALAGWRHWALVGGSLATALCGTLLTFASCPWMPGRMQKGAGVRSMLKFGGHLTGFNFLNYFARNADNFLIGKFLGANALGLYAKAYGLLMLPITQITGPIAAVATPALSRLQNDPDRYRRYYYQSINVIAFITMPMVFLLAALSTEVIQVVLGDQWVDAAPIFKVLAFAAFIQPVTNPTGWVYVSLGQTDRMLRWSFISSPLKVTSFVVGLPWGGIGVAVSYTLCVFILTLPSLWWAFRYSPLTIRRWFTAISKPLLFSLYLYGTIELFKRSTTLQSPILVLVLAGVLTLCLSGVLLVFWRGMRDEMLAIVQLLKLVHRRNPLRLSGPSVE